MQVLNERETRQRERDSRRGDYGFTMRFFSAKYEYLEKWAGLRLLSTLRIGIKLE